MSDNIGRYIMQSGPNCLNMNGNTVRIKIVLGSNFGQYLDFTRWDFDGV